MRLARTLLGFAGAMLVLSLIALFVAGARTHAEILELYFQIDPSSGARIDRFIEDGSWSVPIARAHGDFRDLQLVLTGGALVAIALGLLALRRIGRERGISLVSIVLPLAAILVTGLVIAAFGHNVGQWRERSLCPLTHLHMSEPDFATLGPIPRWRVAGGAELGSYATAAELIPDGELKADH